MENLEKYNGVKVVKTWSLLAFAKEFGKPKFATCKNAEGERFNCLAFDKDGDITFCHFGYSTANISPNEIIRDKDSLCVGLNTNNKYTLFKRGESSWTDLDAIFN